MPANLTAAFIKARNRYREAKSPEAKLAALEEMLKTIPKHKGTDHMQADIKRRMAKLRDAQAVSKKNRSSGHEHIPKEGAGQCVLIGAPNAGKSQLLATLSNAKPEVADWPFSTLVPVPGMMTFEDIPIQLIDLPPVTDEYTEPWVYSLIRACDVGLVVLDATRDIEILDDLADLERLLEARNIRLAEESPEDPDDRVRLIPCRIVLSKCDFGELNADLVAELPYPVICVSAETDWGLDAFRRAVFDALHIVRIYTKLPGKKPDMKEPYTLPEGSTALDAVRMVHRDFVDRLKYVRVWGSGRFDGQQVPSDHRLEDGDVVEIHL